MAGPGLPTFVAGKTMLAYCGLAGALKVSLVFAAFLVGHNRFRLSSLPLSETGEHVCTGACTRFCSSTSRSCTQQRKDNSDFTSIVRLLTRKNRPGSSWRADLLH